MTRLGTRGSALAVAQSGLVARSLEELGEEVELVTIRASGDERPGGAQPPGDPGDKARFVKELEEALLAEEIDLAVHSAKDVPSALPEGLAIVGVPARADARDALCGADALSELPEGASVGTSSLRRRSQLLAGRPDLDVRELRGNVDTRLRRLAAGDCRALVLAAAGLERLGRSDDGVPLAAEEMVPAAGQGCLALEARAGDASSVEAAAALTEPHALRRLLAERALVEAIDATCRTPVGAHAELEGERMRLSAFVGMPDGGHWIRDALDGD
ncbi:MAG TPA: hydroxymethylbilane synthase, partial [Thermoleophilaceae bacterium]|nr:hydroxymethylbilane synthase [Thermoleophilaceae bacterium]